MRGRFAFPHTIQLPRDMAQIGLERPGLRNLLHQRPEGGTLFPSVRAIDLPLDELDLLPRQHGYSTRSRSVCRSRSRAVNRRDLTVRTGISSTSAISS